MGSPRRFEMNIIRHPDDLERLIHRECRIGRDLIFLRCPELPNNTLLMSVAQGGRITAFLKLEISALMTTLKAYEPLDESVFYYSDMPGFRPNDVWYERRNRRLSIGSLSKNETMSATFSAGAELILSYSNSSSGMAIVESVQAGVTTRAGTSVVHSGFLLSLIFLGGVPEKSNESWFEEVLIPS